MSSAICFNLDQSKILLSGNELTHYQTTNFRLFQTERVCRPQFQISQKWVKLSKWVENTVGKGEIARYEQFLFFPQCFQNACFPGASKGVIMWEWVKEKKRMLPTSIFSFSHIVIYSDRDKLITIRSASNLLAVNLIS